MISVASARRDWALVASAFVVLAVVASVWFALDRHPPEWDHANHLERAVLCARDLAAGSLTPVIERSAFYPPLVPCLASLPARQSADAIPRGGAAEGGGAP